MTKVLIENYNPNWSKEFILLKNIYNDILKDFKIIIEHVGSTSIEGLAAKPILDIDIIIENENELSNIIKKLEKVGYKYLGDMGIVERYAFKRTSDKVPIYNNAMYEFNHHLYVCKNNSISLKNHMLFRDYLRKDKLALQEYADLKRKLAIKYSNDIDLYCEAKTNFITSILKKSGFEQIEIDDITIQNSI